MSTSIARQWNKAWDEFSVSLVPVPKNFNRRGLEGADDFSRRVIRQFFGTGTIFSEEMFNRLLEKVSEFGYCLEYPGDWEWTNV